jgi:hypothetical protein
VRAIYRALQSIMTSSAAVLIQCGAEFLICPTTEVACRLEGEDGQVAFDQLPTLDRLRPRHSSAKSLDNPSVVKLEPQPEQVARRVEKSSAVRVNGGEDG